MHVTNSSLNDLVVVPVLRRVYVIVDAPYDDSDSQYCSTVLVLCLHCVPVVAAGLMSL